MTALNELREQVKVLERFGLHAAANALRTKVWALERHIDPETVERHLPEPDTLRDAFERQARCSHGFRRSRRGTYVNPATARDWKWFQLGHRAAKT